MPDYKDKGCPIEHVELKDEFYYLTPKGNFTVPYIPAYMHNDGCHVISLSQFTRWLGGIAEEMGVMIFPGFSGTKVLFDEDRKAVLGIVTGDKGIDKEIRQKSTFEPGVNLTARVTVFGEGPKGSLIREVANRLGIFSDRFPQVFETAIKEVIRLPESNPFLNSATSVLHTFGYPLGLDTKGGGFLYKMTANRISLGLVTGLDYTDPFLEPYEAFIHFKHHPLIADIIKGGKVLQQGAKTLAAGGYYSMPQLAVNGAMFVGDSASMLNIRRLKGIHTAMKSGMLASETIIDAFAADNFSLQILKNYEAKLKSSWILEELWAARNFPQALAQKGVGKIFHIGAQQLTKGHGFIDPMPIEKDSTKLSSLQNANNKIIPKKQLYDGKLYVDKLTGVYLSGTQHEEDQPCHLDVLDMKICVNQCRQTYGNPCTRFCPGQVYEMDTDGEPQLKLSPSNCLHCKTCEIKDSYENIIWKCPEGGDGPNYSIA